MGQQSVKSFRTNRLWLSYRVVYNLTKSPLDESLPLRQKFVNWLQCPEVPGNAVVRIVTAKQPTRPAYVPFRC